MIKKQKLTAGQSEQLGNMGLDITDLKEALALLKSNGASKGLCSRFARSSGLQASLHPWVLIQCSTLTLLKLRTLFD